MSPFKWNKFSQLGNNVSSSGVTWGGGSWKLDKAWAVTSLPPGTGREFNNQLITGHSVIAYQLTKANITPLTSNGLHFHLCRHASLGFYLLTYKRPSNPMLKTHNNKVMCCANCIIIKMFRLHLRDYSLLKFWRTQSNAGRVEIAEHDILSMKAGNIIPK